MSSNANLHAAKANKNDEFYTRYKDIEAELCHYTEHFKDKVVYCNCDDWEWSNFYKYFYDNFEQLGLKKLITTCIAAGTGTYKYSENQLNLFADEEPKGKIAEVYYENGKKIAKTGFLQENGDFRSRECKELLKQADIVVTNPPFSLFRQFVYKALNAHKDLIVVAPLGNIMVKSVFPYVQKGHLQIGFTKPKGFIGTNKELITMGNICWFTSFDMDLCHPFLKLHKTYSPNKYPKYDNFEAIEVSKIESIPCDYDGIMGVPITFLERYNSKQFRIIGIAKKALCNELRTKEYGKQIQYNEDGSTEIVTKLNDNAAILCNSIPEKYPYYKIADKYYILKYGRILIQRKKAE